MHVPCFRTGDFTAHHLFLQELLASDKAFWHAFVHLLVFLFYCLLQDAEYGRALDSLVKAVPGASAAFAKAFPWL